MKKSRHFSITFTLFFISSLIGYLIYFAWQYSNNHPSTENAYVRAKIVSIAPQIKGRIISVEVNDYQKVNKGDLLLKIDPQPYLLAVKRAESAYQLAVQQHQVADSKVTQAIANLNGVTSNLKETQIEFKRTQALVSRKLSSQQELDIIKNKLAIAQAKLEEARANVEAAIANRGDDNGVDAAIVQQASAELAQAELDLSYTDITAPTDGLLGEINVFVGSVVKNSQMLFPLVVKNTYWVRANFKETSLTNIRMGQTAEVVIDMYPDITWQAKVSELSPASGTSFSLMPPENATGNWVKIKQRYPVKLILDIPKDSPQLRIGASAEVTINLSDDSRT
ncbi:multidrug resistance protein A [Aliivibrio fischeri ES114]|uniref:Multidrug resistance protein A n=1 Tax=Aliivibrio fischeri (strain ATCC 700601 / ES114) TaxID=312309 RepID=Q5DYH3_ALIF1|nr:HlyD family secretion protein [Aliivibrio fischeri]AAW88173.1 multidrug resistance protein A [Aliivibrio fischeri ES114]KLU80649.1 hemolysin D [Aliivibrio fischeri]MUJ19163.1 HlyD family efflux transporter periplasmic adaptor subunit [Aliivibrio fischeri]MUL10689.1 HlyD family efflux transporter periplasmic adaptor subunit [Aliivibrio fischeri]MUL13872.1 HlyD family efflux transporter periplasmic adaptor subunit [Aliivibrio fischeri]